MSATIPIRLYRPSNGTEGESFIADWCGTCARDGGMLKGLPLEECDDNQICHILGNTFLYSIHESDYPREWTYDKNGAPCCTAYVEAGTEIPAIDTHTIDMFETNT